MRSTRSGGCATPQVVDEEDENCARRALAAPGLVVLLLSVKSRSVALHSTSTGDHPGSHTVRRTIVSQSGLSSRHAETMCRGILQN
jgi:hypothetical protein